MNRKGLIVIATLAVAVVVITLVPYALRFDGLSSDHHRWGQFGDYVGGLLNPAFALAAFLAALYAIVLQGAEVRRSKEHSEKEALANEMLAVMHLIDDRVNTLLGTHVGTVSTGPPLNRLVELSFVHMLAEAQRMVDGASSSPGFDNFVQIGRSPGSTIESAVRELLDLTLQMKAFIAEFELSVAQSRSPFLAYYAGRMARLCVLLEHFDLGVSPQSYFASVVRQHRALH